MITTDIRSISVTTETIDTIGMIEMIEVIEMREVIGVIETIEAIGIDNIEETEMEAETGIDKDIINISTSQETMGAEILQHNPLQTMVLMLQTIVIIFYS